MKQGKMGDIVNKTKPVPTCVTLYVLFGRTAVLLPGQVFLSESSAVLSASPAVLSASLAVLSESLADLSESLAAVFVTFMVKKMRRYSGQTTLLNHKGHKRLHKGHKGLRERTTHQLLLLGAIP